MKKLTLMLAIASFATACEEFNPCAVGTYDPGPPRECVLEDGTRVPLDLPDSGVHDDASPMLADSGPGDAGSDAAGMDATAPDACVLRRVYFDSDGDGYGDPLVSMEICDAPGAGWVEDDTDCDDTCEVCWSDAAESCDTEDNDCDGAVDEGTLTTFYRDADGDTHGSITDSVEACAAPTGYVALGDDCNDACMACHPGGSEVCEGSLDENCMGGVDEGCACTLGATRPCGSSAVGACRRGTQTCGASGWGACSGAIEPVAETCNLRDDDCDSRTDEMVQTTYYRDADGDTYGVTSMTMLACSMPSGYANRGGDCNDTTGSIRPGAVEICDGVIDHDCDSVPDLMDGCACANGSTRACPGGMTVGECRAGTQTCASGAWASCVGRVDPVTETCNARDDDCDTRTDEAALICGASSVCSAGSCVPLPLPRALEEVTGDTRAAVRSIQPRPSGGYCIAGTWEGASLRRGSTTLLGASSGMDAFVACFAADGTLSWSQPIYGSGEASADALAIDPSGRVYVSGNYTGTLSASGYVVGSSGGRDAFVIAYTAAGTRRWGQRVATSGDDQASGVAADMTHVFAVGASGPNMFAANFTADGALDWIRTATSPGGGSPDRSVATAAAILPDGRRVAAGALVGEGVVIDGRSVVPPSSWNSSAFVAAWSSTGTLDWLHFSSGGGGLGEGDGVRAAVPTPDGGLALIGYYYGGVFDLAGATLSDTPDSSWSGFAMSLTAAGTLRWARGVTGLGDQRGWSGAVDSDGNVYAGIAFDGEFVFDGSTLAATTGTDTALLSWTASGAPRWSVRGGGASQEYPNGLATSGDELVAAFGFSSAGTTAGGLSLAGRGTGSAALWFLRSR